MVKIRSARACRERRIDADEWGGLKGEIGEDH
jgi:hypothetical protein